MNKPSPESRSTVSNSLSKMIGVELGDFHLLRHLGTGGMSSVFLAKQKSLHRQVAIKLMKPELLDEEDETYLKRFSQEATAAAALNHPNIVQVYSIGEEQGYHYIAQEYVQGVNLRQYIDKHGPLDLKLTISLIRQIASALQKAGEIGIVHRDIKPDNILLNRKGQVKVADFGLARIAKQGDKGDLTQAGTTLGTPLYMSPEQVHGETLDQRSDIYSLGITAYFMLAGKPPFEGDNAVTIAMKHINQKPVALNKHRPDIPQELRRVIEKMMTKDRKRRYSDCQEILNELKRLFPKSIPSTEPVIRDWESQLHIPTTASQKWSLKKHIALLTCTSLITAACAAGMGWFQRPNDLLSKQVNLKEHLKETPADQFNFAFNQEIDGKDPEPILQALLTEESFKNQSEYRQYRRLAQLKLGQLYLVKQLYEDALHMFNEVQQNSAPKNDPIFSKALAGKAVTYCLMQNHADANRVLGEELPSRWKDLDPATETDLVHTALNEVGIALGSKVQRRYQEKYPHLEFDFQ